MTHKIYTDPVPQVCSVEHVVCHNRQCVNPAHLKALTHDEKYPPHVEEPKIAPNPSLVEAIERIEAELKELKEMKERMATAQ